MASESRPIGYRRGEQLSPPAAQRVTDVAVTTFEQVYEVDPRLMEQWVLQQEFPNWDTLRILQARRDHLTWMHRHFAHRVLSGADLLSEIGEEADR